MSTIDTSRGMRNFIFIWIGELISTLGSQLTGFALGVRIYQHTESVTQYAFIAFFMTLPAILISPLAGVLVDRWDRRRVMILSNIGAALSILMLIALFYANRLQISFVYASVAFGSVFGAFMWPAFSASIPLMVPKKHLVRANGMLQLGQGMAQILAPLLAGSLLAVINITGLMFINIATFAFAVTILLFIVIPRPEISAEGAKAKGSLWREAKYGWIYIAERSGLLRLLFLFAILNFTVSIVEILMVPLILGFASPAALGTVMSVAGAGMLTGSLLISIWSGPRRRIRAILGFALIQGTLLFLAGFKPNVPLVAGASFLFLFCFPIISSCSQAIWQSKVVPDIQGRVFAIRTVIAFSSLPLAYLLAGPLADYVFEPLLSDGGLLAANVGRVIGTGPGRGIAFLYIVMGVFFVLTVICGYLNPRLRLVEDELPDVLRDDTSVCASEDEKQGSKKEVHP